MNIKRRFFFSEVFKSNIIGDSVADGEEMFAWLFA